MLPAASRDGHEHAPAAVFRGILDEVAEHFVEILALHPDLGGTVAGDVDGDAFMHPLDRALDGLQALPHPCAGLGRGAAADGARAGEVVIDLAAHHRRLSAHDIVQLGVVRGRRVGDDGERGLQGVGEVAGMTPRFLGLLLAVRQELVDLLGQRPDLGREILADAGLLARSDRGDLAAHAAQRPQAINRLQRGQN